MTERGQPGAVGLHDPGGADELALGAQHAHMNRIAIEVVELQLVRVILGAEEPPLQAVGLVS